MKKLASLATSALMALGLSTPAFAQNIGIEQPKEARITDLGRLISTGVSVVIIIAGILVFVYLVWGGLEWLTSGGDKGKTESARNRITAALVGLAIIAASWALVRIIAYFFGVESGIGGALTIPKPY
jgi:hypothetical protein